MKTAITDTIAFPLVLAALVLLSASGPGSLQAASEHALGQAAGNCGNWARALPDTGQTASYTATFGEDHDYQPADAQPDYTIFNPVGHSSVTVDNNTGLMWMTNPTDAGITRVLLWEDALTTCENMDYAGYTDWRLPNIKDLRSISYFGAYNPAVDTAYFKCDYDNCNLDWFWSSTTYAANSSQAFILNFWDGSMWSVDKTNPTNENSCVRCVRGGLGGISTHSLTNCALPDTSTGAVSYTATWGEDTDYDPTDSYPSYTIYNPVGVSSVTVDNRTGLMWITNPVDAGVNGTYTWTAALTACEDLSYAGYTDWRLPNIMELASLVDYGKSSAPRINTAAFLNTSSDGYWTSTTYLFTTANALRISFNTGYTQSSYAKTTSIYIRCVRGGP